MPADQADVAKARELLTDLHDGHNTSKFQQDWSKVSKDHRAAVEAEMKRQETAFRTLYPGSGSFGFKDDGTAKGLEVDKVDPKTGRTLGVDFKEAGSGRGAVGSDQKGGKQQTETPDQAADRNRRAEAADNTLRANHYLQALGGVGSDGRPLPADQVADAKAKAISEFNGLPREKRQAVVDAMQKQQQEHPSVPAVANVYNADGTIRDSRTSSELLAFLANGQRDAFDQIHSKLSPADRAAVDNAMYRENAEKPGSPVVFSRDPSGISEIDAPYKTVDKKGKEHIAPQAPVYKSDQLLSAEARQDLFNLRNGNGTDIDKFDKMYHSLPPDQQKALAAALKTELSKLPPDGRPASTVEIGPDGTLTAIKSPMRNKSGAWEMVTVYPETEFKKALHTLEKINPFKR